jgi:PAS domain S-box-containing protein
MKKGENDEPTAASRATLLRQQAEERLRITNHDIERMSAAQVQRVVHELQVTQIELQLQNEELQQAQVELEAARNRYQYLYDYSPVGYLTLTPEGVILEANLTAATLLATDRKRLIGALLTRLLATEAHDTLYLHLRQVAKESGLCSCDVVVSHATGSRHWLRLESIAERSARGLTTQCRMAVLDITARKKAEAGQQLLEVQEAERRHLARELHDEVMQTLTALQMNLDLLADQQPIISNNLTTSMALVDDLMEQVRTLSLELRPIVLDELGLARALEWYCQRQVPKLGLRAHYTRDPALPRPNPTVETACFRVVQEAITNVAKHARVSEVWIDLHREGDTLHLTIRDQGVGFDVRTHHQHGAQGAGVGLRGMEERIQLIGGRLDIRSAPGHGTEIHAWVALAPPATEGGSTFNTEG